MKNLTSRRSVLFIVHSEYPVGEARVRRQATAAVDAGWRARVLCLATPDAPSICRADGVLVRRTQVQRTRDYSVGGLVREYGGFATRVLPVAALEDHDVVVVANPPDFLLHVALPSRLRGAALVFDVHDLSTDLFQVRLGVAPRHPVMRCLALLERSACRLADEVVTVHKPYADEIARRTRGRVRPHVVMNSADPRLFRPRVEVPSGAPIVMYHGTLTGRYGVFDLLRSFAEVRAAHPGSQLWLFGDGDGRDELCTAGRRLGLGSAVTVSETWYTSERIAELIRQATLGVIPNKPNALNRYALSTKLFEYVCVGVPVVCAGLPTLRAHFKEDELLFYAPGDVADLTAKLGWALDHPAEMNEMAVRAQRHYERDYAWPQQRKVFLDVLERVAEARSGPR